MVSKAHCISWFLNTWERVEQLIHSAGEKCDEIINIFMHSNCYNCLTNKEVTKLVVFIYNVIPGVSRPPKRQAAKQVTLYYMWPACLQAYTTVSLIFFIIFSLFLRLVWPLQKDSTLTRRSCHSWSSVLIFTVLKEIMFVYIDQFS